METQRVLNKIRRNPVLIGAFASTLAYAACVYPWSAHGRYRGTVVDEETGDPIEGAAVVLVWTKCRVYEMDGCGIDHSVRETVTDLSGRFSISAVPDPDWNPFTYVKRDGPYKLIYALGYLPLSSEYPTVPELEKDALTSFDQKLQEGHLIPLVRRDPLTTGGRWGHIERQADPQEWEKLDTPRLKALIKEQERRIQQAISHGNPQGRTL